MRVELHEYDGCFEISLVAETVEEAAQLVRMGMNTTKELRYQRTYAYQSGISADVVLGKSKRADASVPKRGGR